MNAALGSFLRSFVCSLGLVAAASLLSPAARPARLDFTHDVLPILQRQGCSSAYCHGSATGRAGFQLSLFGSDPAADYAAITTQLGGRRVDLRDADLSLFLQKALGGLDHGGGRRVVRDGAAHRALRDWIAAGAPWRAGEPRHLHALHVDVRGERVVVEATFRMLANATAEACDVVQDVTDTALFSSTDPTVVDVDADGRVAERGPGQAHLMARFGNLTAVTRILRPFAVPIAALPQRPAHALDRAWLAHLTELGLLPATSVDALQLARRLHMDLVGRPPTPQELDAFVARPDVPATVTRLVARGEFAEVWGAHLARWFELPEPGEERAEQADAARWREAFVASVANGESLPVLGRRVVLDDLGGLDRFGDPRDRAEYAGRTLLGMRIGCARCHDHPSDRWRREEHLAFSACFASPRPDGAGGMTAGAMFAVDSGERVEPRFLSLTPTVSGGPGATNGRAQLADFLLRRDHGAFARNACNRVFAVVFGRGLVEPLDDHRLGNPPLAAGMLDALVEEFDRCEGRLPALLTFLLTSAAYAAPGAMADGPDAAHLAARASRPLAPDAYLRALAAVVGWPGRASLPSSPLARELALRNGPLVHELLAAGGTTIDATYELCNTPHERLVELWRTVLSRSPRADEADRFQPLAAQDLPAFRDLAYALLTGREFGHRR